jgi:hypothetical protein
LKCFVQCYIFYNVDYVIFHNTTMCGEIKIPTADMFCPIYYSFETDLQ